MKRGLVHCIQATGGRPGLRARRYSALRGAPAPDPLLPSEGCGLRGRAPRGPGRARAREPLQSRCLPSGPCPGRPGPPPETRCGPALRSEPHFPPAGRGAAESISCCAAEPSGDVIAVTLPRVAAAPGPKFRPFPGGPSAARGRGRGGRGSRLLEPVPAPGARSARGPPRGGGAGGGAGGGWRGRSSSQHHASPATTVAASRPRVFPRGEAKACVSRCLDGKHRPCASFSA